MPEQPHESRLTAHAPGYEDAPADSLLHDPDYVPVRTILVNADSGFVSRGDIAHAVAALERIRARHQVLRDACVRATDLANRWSAEPDDSTGLTYASTYGELLRAALR